MLQTRPTAINVGSVFRLLCAIVLAAALPGCTYPYYKAGGAFPTSITLEHLRVVKLRDIPDFYLKGRERFDISSRTRRSVLEVSFALDNDLMRFGKYNDFVVVYAALCEAEGKEQSFWQDITASHFVYKGQFAVVNDPRLTSENAQDQRPEIDPSIPYSVYVDFDWRSEADEERPYNVNLIDKPADVCLKLHGGEKYGSSSEQFHTQILRIPAAAIQSALKQAGSIRNQL